MSCLRNLKTSRPPQDLYESELLNHCAAHQTSFWAAQILEEDRPLAIVLSPAGFYLGCYNERGPMSRDSEYFPTLAAARKALNNRTWTQRMDL